MPRFYFDLSGPLESIDDLGSELPDADAAQVEAIRFFADALRDHPDREWSNGHPVVRVLDEKRRALFNLEVKVSID